MKKIDFQYVEMFYEAFKTNDHALITKDVLVFFVPLRTHLKHSGNR